MDYEVAFFSAPYMDRFGGFGMDVKNALIEIMVNSTDPESDWDAFIETMMPRVQPILNELNDGLFYGN